jgi:hypothetical protein
MKYAVQMASGAMIYIPSFIKIGSGIRNLMGGYTETQKQIPRQDLLKYTITIFAFLNLLEIFTKIQAFLKVFCVVPIFQTSFFHNALAMCFCLRVYVRLNK